MDWIKKKKAEERGSQAQSYFPLLAKFKNKRWQNSRNQQDIPTIKVADKRLPGLNKLAIE
jgi:hypothetical protein